MRKFKFNVDDTPIISSRGGEIQILVSPKTVESTQLVMGLSRLQVNEKILPHIHDYSEESFFVLKGQGRIHLDEREQIDFTEGDAVLVPKGVLHWIENTGTDVMEVVFSVAPLAPSPELGHRNVVVNKQESLL